MSVSSARACSHSIVVGLAHKPLQRSGYCGQTPGVRQPQKSEMQSRYNTRLFLFEKLPINKCITLDIATEHEYII